MERIRLVKTLYPPILTLDTGLSYHMFNSYNWSTGQDCARHIKRSLQRVLPGSIIFLDVDDLDDRERIESHVVGSATVLLTLSQGYLTNRLCLREVRCAIANAKPLVRVYDGTTRTEVLRNTGERAPPPQARSPSLAA